MPDYYEYILKHHIDIIGDLVREKHGLHPDTKLDFKIAVRVDDVKKSKVKIKKAGVKNGKRIK